MPVAGAVCDIHTGFLENLEYHLSRQIVTELSHKRNTILILTVVVVVVMVPSEAEETGQCHSLRTALATGDVGGWVRSGKQRKVLPLDGQSFDG